MPSTSKFIVVDGSGYIFRAFFALKQARGGGRQVNLSRSDGMPTGALHVFTSMLFRLTLDEQPERCVVVFDAEGKTFRDAIDPEYKANRNAPPDELIPQFPWFEKIVGAFNLPCLKLKDVEADDVIATLVDGARAEGLDVAIYTGDKDLMQLVDEHVVCIDTMKDRTYDVAGVVEKFGVRPDQVSDFLALRGDSVDNIPGIEGVGDVTAAKLLVEHGTIDGILAAAPTIKGKLGERLRDPVQLERLARSRKLVALKRDVVLPRTIESLRRTDWDLPELSRILKELEFEKLLARVERAFKSDPATYTTAVDEAALTELATRARAAGTIGLDVVRGPGSPVDAPLVGFAIAIPGAPPAYVPIGHRVLGATLAPLAVVRATLGPVLADPAVKKIIVDAKGAGGVLGRHGLALAGVTLDPALAAHLIDGGQSGDDVQSLARAHLGHETVPLVEVTGKGKERRTLDESPVEAVRHLAGEGADVALALARQLGPRLDAMGLRKLHDEVELPLGPVLVKLEQAGIKVDVAELRRLSQELGARCAKLEDEVAELVGQRVNLGSPKQLGELLFEKMGLRAERMRKTKLGWSTDAEQLEEVADQHPAVPKILEHRELTKLKGTYLDALPPLVHPQTSRIHTTFVMTGATTGRLASHDPNLQNIPIRTEVGRSIRRAFIAEPGHVLVSADYSQIELRVLAHLCKDPVLTRAFAEGIDVHAQTAAEVFGIPLAEVNAEHRRVAKAVNYGLGYGQTDFGLARALGIPRDEARRYIEGYFARFAGVRTYMDTVIAEAHTHGGVRTIMGRLLPTPGIGSSRFPERSQAERLARNYPIQGSAAEILKVAMIRVDRALTEEPGLAGARMLLTVHDELVFEVPEAQAQAVAARVREIMETSVPLAVPSRVDVGIAASWADAH